MHLEFDAHGDFSRVSSMEGKFNNLMLVSNHPKCPEGPAPVVRVHELAHNLLNFICLLWVNTADYWDTHWDLTRTVKERFDAEGVSIPYPQRDVQLCTTGE